MNLLRMSLKPTGSNEPSHDLGLIWVSEHLLGPPPQRIPRIRNAGLLLRFVPILFGRSSVTEGEGARKAICIEVTVFHTVHSYNTEQCLGLITAMSPRRQQKHLICLAIAGSSTFNTVGHPQPMVTHVALRGSGRPLPCSVEFHNFFGVAMTFFS